MTVCCYFQRTNKNVPFLGVREGLKDGNAMKYDCDIARAQMALDMLRFAVFFFKKTLLETKKSPPKFFKTRFLISIKKQSLMGFDTIEINLA